MFGNRVQGARDLDESSESEDSGAESVWSLSSDEEMEVDECGGLQEGNVFLLGARVNAIGTSCPAYPHSHVTDTVLSQEANPHRAEGRQDPAQVSSKAWNLLV
jgi:hypothetical protein